MGIKTFFKKAGKVIAAPVTAPVKLAKKGADRIMHAAILGVIRHVLTFAGGALSFTGDDLTAFVGAASTLIGLCWSLIEKKKAAAPAQ